MLLTGPEKPILELLAWEANTKKTIPKLLLHKTIRGCAAQSSPLQVYVREGIVAASSARIPAPLAKCIHDVSCQPGRMVSLPQFAVGELSYELLPAGNFNQPNSVPAKRKSLAMTESGPSSLARIWRFEKSGSY